MTNGLAVVGLSYDGYDLQRADFNVMFEITEGLDGLPQTRSTDFVIPFRRGRVPSKAIADSRPIIATGWVTGPATTLAKVAYRGYLDGLKRTLDPTTGPRVLRVMLEDASTRWIRAVPRNMIPGTDLGSDWRAFSIEWAALDPYWYGNFGSWALDGGLYLDTGLFLDDNAPIVVVPTTASLTLTVDTQGSAEVERVTLQMTGPSLTAPGIEVDTTTGVVGFSMASALTAGQVLVVDNFARTAKVGAASVRGSMTLKAGNQHGEYVRLAAGTNTVRLIGQPAEARLTIVPTYF